MVSKRVTGLKLGELMEQLRARPYRTKRQKRIEATIEFVLLAGTIIVFCFVWPA